MQRGQRRHARLGGALLLQEVPANDGKGHEELAEGVAQLHDPGGPEEVEEDPRGQAPVEVESGVQAFELLPVDLGAVVVVPADGDQRQEVDREDPRHQELPQGLKQGRNQHGPHCHEALRGRPHELPDVRPMVRHVRNGPADGARQGDQERAHDASHHQGRELGLAAEERIQAPHFRERQRRDEQEDARGPKGDEGGPKEAVDQELRALVHHQHVEVAEGHRQQRGHEEHPPAALEAPQAADAGVQGALEDLLPEACVHRHAVSAAQRLGVVWVRVDDALLRLHVEVDDIPELPAWDPALRPGLAAAVVLDLGVEAGYGVVGRLHVRALLHARRVPQV
mmetsp:Transcript_59552/g.184784  ORF Transcript_59552/g.184784 Transcript_59552/m.184784 type:complete len:338 (+) Transcript_59552:1175-2188(+)